MLDYRETASEIVKRNLGKARFDEICEQFGLSAANKQVLNELFSDWKASSTLADIVAVSGKYKGRSSIGRVIQARTVMAREVAEVSAFRRGSKNS